MRSEDTMNVNVGTADRAIRIIIGLALLSLLFLLQGNARWLGLIGIVPLGTGLTRRCPAYTLLGTSTCETKTS
jgi:hypothetical protein